MKLIILNQQGKMFFQLARNQKMPNMHSNHYISSQLSFCFSVGSNRCQQKSPIAIYRSPNVNLFKAKSAQNISSKTQIPRMLNIQDNLHNQDKWAKDQQIVNRVQHQNNSKFQPYKNKNLEIYNKPNMRFAVNNYRLQKRPKITFQYNSPPHNKRLSTLEGKDFIKTIPKLDKSQRYRWIGKLRQEDQKTEMKQQKKEDYFEKSTINLHSSQLFSSGSIFSAPQGTALDLSLQIEELFKDNIDNQKQSQEASKAVKELAELFQQQIIMNL